MEGKKMVQVEVNVNPSESFDRALARFKKMCGKAGIVTEIKKRSFYEKPSEKRRRIEMKRQRKVKPRRIMGAGPRSNNAVRS
jgi:small subunit ribosomal protein S21